MVNQYIPLPRTILSDNNLQFCSKLSQAIYQLLGVRKLATSSYHPNGNGGVKRVNHTMAQMLAMVVNEHQDDRDLQLPHVEFAYNNSVSAVTGLAPNEVHKGRLPRLPLTVFERVGVTGHQSLARDQPGLLRPGYRPTAARERCCSQTPCPHRSRITRRNSALTDAQRPVPKFAVGGWAWVYNSPSIIRQGMKANTDAKVLKAKLALNWTGPYKVLEVGPCSSVDTRTAPHSAITSSTWISLPTCPVRMLVGVWR